MPADANRALSAETGFRALDVSSTLAGADCIRLLSAGGVDVVRAEAPGGQWLRRWSETGATIREADSGALFKWLAGGQRSVTVDTTLGQHNDEILRELLGLTDVEIAGLRERKVIGEALAT